MQAPSTGKRLARANHASCFFSSVRALTDASLGLEALLLAGFEIGNVEVFFDVVAWTVESTLGLAAESCRNKQVQFRSSMIESIGPRLKVIFQLVDLNIDKKKSKRTENHV